MIKFVKEGDGFWPHAMCGFLFSAFIAFMFWWLIIVFATVSRNSFLRLMFLSTIFSCMKSYTIQEVKEELNNTSPQRIKDLCLRLAKYKKENKELLVYLLFHAHSEQQYIEDVKKEMDILFTEINTATFYYAKKGLRKILRFAGRHIKYAASKQAEAELLIHFCILLKQSSIVIRKSNAIHNIYLQQIKKIKTAVASLHEDLQHDYLKQIENDLQLL